jgi:transcriptional regulator with XRE-family HTH domain
MNHYKTITARPIDVTSLSLAEKEALAQLLDEHARSPSWDKFSDYWQRVLRPLLAKVRTEERPHHPLYRIAQDLEMRLGIAQGSVAEPDYRDYLVDRIEEKYGSRYRFCKETGIPEAFLSQVLSGKKDFSIETLRKAAAALDLGLALLPSRDVAELPSTEFSALRRICAVVCDELATLATLEDHLRRTDPQHRRTALHSERSMIDGVVEAVLRELDRFPVQEQGEKVFEIISREMSERDSLLTLLRSRIVTLEDERSIKDAQRARSLTMI